LRASSDEGRFRVLLLKKPYRQVEDKKKRKKITQWRQKRAKGYRRVTVVWTLFRCSPVRIAGVSPPYGGIAPLAETDRADIS